MRDDLERFGQSLDPTTSPRLQKAVTDTIALMGGSVDTIDILVQKLDNGQLDQQIGAQNVDPLVSLEGRIHGVASKDARDIAF